MFLLKSNLKRFIHSFAAYIHQYYHPVVLLPIAFRNFLTLYTAGRENILTSENHRKRHCVKQNSFALSLEKHRIFGKVKLFVLLTFQNVIERKKVPI